MNRKYLVSVIVCNYNYASFLPQAIESVLNQSYTNFELIIVDDGSTDNSLKIIEEYQDNRIKVIAKDNGGQASAFNTAYQEVNGDIVCFLDSDDWWKQEKLEIILKWHEFLNGDYSILQHSVNVWDKSVTTPYKYVLPTGDCLSEMKRTRNIDFFVPTSGLSFPKEVLDKVFPIPEIFRISADAYIMRTAFVFGNVYSIPESLGFYRKHNNAVFGNNKFDASIFFREKLFPELNNFYRKNNINYKFDTKPTHHRSLIKKVKQAIKRIGL